MLLLKCRSSKCRPTNNYGIPIALTRTRSADVASEAGCCRLIAKQLKLGDETLRLCSLDVTALTPHLHTLQNYEKKKIPCFTCVSEIVVMKSNVAGAANRRWTVYYYYFFSRASASCNISLSPTLMVICGSLFLFPLSFCFFFSAFSKCRWR